MGLSFCGILDPAAVEDCTKFLFLLTNVLLRNLRTGVRNLRPAGQMRSARTFNMPRIRIFVSQERTQHCVKTKLRDKQTRRQQVKRSLHRSVTWFSLLFFFGRQK